MYLGPGLFRYALISKLTSFTNTADIITHNITDIILVDIILFGDYQYVYQNQYRYHQYQY